MAFSHPSGSATVVNMDTTIIKRTSGGHSFNEPPALNSAGIAYTAFITCYTAFILYSITMLWMYRKHPAIRVRGFWMTTAALISLHVYVAALFIVYPLNSYYKCGTEFWYMSIIFPLGIAIFQAANIKLMAVASQQMEFAELQRCLAEKKEPFPRSISAAKKRLHTLDYVKRTFVAIGLGILLQLVVTCVLFFGSRRFSPHTGYFGVHVDASKCRSGPEWVPSVLWQFLWAWFFGPYVLYRTRHIKDTHNWALQTRLCVIACLPGTPMWLGFIYAGGETMAVFNSWWPPAMWFAPGLITMQLSTIIIPFLEIWRKRESRRPQSLHSITSVATSRASTADGLTKSDVSTSWESFEFQLKHNIHALLMFAATKDFTGENIIFLRDIRDFKRKWRRRLQCPPTGGLTITMGEQRDMFEDAARIYYELVCAETSRSCVNLEFRVTAPLKEMFKDVTYEPPADSIKKKSSSSSLEFGKPAKHEVAPWDSPPMRAASLNDSSSPLIDPDTSVRKTSGSSDTTLSFPEAVALDSLGGYASYDLDTIVPVDSHISFAAEPLLQPDRAMTVQRGRIIPKHTEDQTMSNIGVPSGFNLRVFDKAEQSIKYLVYTNTWRSYANSIGGSSRLNSVELNTTNLTTDIGIGATAPRIETPDYLDLNETPDFLDLNAEPHAQVTDSKGKARETTTQVTAAALELYHPDLEMANNDTYLDSIDIHHGVLDTDSYSLSTHEVDSRCACCRAKDKRLPGRVYIPKPVKPAKRTWRKAFTETEWYLF